jgi:hypothetical protein
VSVISVFDGGACALFDGRIGVDRFPPAHDAAVVLTAVKDAARRRRRWPEGGPSLTAAARVGWGWRRSGRKDGPPVEQKDADFPLPLPTCSIEFGKRKRLVGLGAPHQFQKQASCRLP